MRGIIGVVRGKLYLWIAQQNLDILGRYREYIVFHKKGHKYFPIVSWFYLLWLLFTMAVLHIDTDDLISGTERKKKIMIGCESCVHSRRHVRLLARQLLNYSVVIFDVLDVMVIPMFENQGNNSKEFFIANTYNKLIFDILKENKKRIIAFSNSAITSGRIEEILEGCGYKGIENVICLDGCDMSNQGVFLRQSVEALYPDEDLQVIHIGGDSKYIFDPSYRNRWKYKYYRSIKSSGIRFRPAGMTGISGSSYISMVNEHIHNGMKKYSVQYELGFIYGGMIYVVLSELIYPMAIKKNAAKVVFICRGGELLKEAFKIQHEDIQAESKVWDSHILKDKNSVEQIIVKDYYRSIIESEGNVLVIGKIYDPDYNKGFIEFIKGEMPGHREVVDFFTLLSTDEQLNKSAETLKALYSKYSGNGKGNKEKTDFDEILRLLFTAMPHSLFEYSKAIDKDYEFEFFNIDIDSFIIIKDIQKGIMDFVKKFRNRYGEHYEKLNLPAFEIKFIIEHLLKSRRRIKRYLQLVKDVNNVASEYINEK